MVVPMKECTYSYYIQRGVRETGANWVSPMTQHLVFFLVVVEFERLLRLPHDAKRLIYPQIT